MGRRFDLALCLDVTEHLPRECADPLVTLLTSLAPVVAFSAAIPVQDSYNHVNCQWPAYWFRLGELELRQRRLGPSQPAGQQPP